MSKSRSDGMTRRRFIQATSGGAAAMGTGLVSASALAAPTTQPSDDKTQKPNYPKPKLPFGYLGRTEYPATMVSLGAILLEGKTGSRVLKLAIDRGINLVHTSMSYGRGKSVASVGGLFKAEPEYRDKVWLCLKSFHPEKEEEIDDMLTALGTDHADIIMTTFMKPDKARLEAIQKQQDNLIKKGKLRHTGFVCHEDMNGVLEFVLKEAPDYFDAALLAMRMLPAGQVPNDGKAREQGMQFSKNLKALRKAGVGVVAMKTGVRDRGKLNLSREAYEPIAKGMISAGTDTVLTSMNAFEQVEMATSLKLKWPHPSPQEAKKARKLIEAYGDPCTMCGNCTKACPQGLPVADLMRFRMYDQSYDWPTHARNEYKNLGVDFVSAASRCGDCSACGEVCPVNLASRELVATTAARLA